MTEFQQMALPVTLPDDETFTSFFGGDNSLVVKQLEQGLELTASTPFNYVYLCGFSDSGKSHLLYASCIHAQELGHSCFLLSCKDIVNLDPSVFDDLDKLDVICIDDIQCIAGNAVWEKALFNFYNRFNNPGKMLVIAADLLPNMLNIELPDLESRLNWGTTFQVRSMSDDDKAEALVKRANMRGLTLTEEATHFLLSRVSRDMRALLDILNQLDHASIIEQRKLTIPFIKSTLNL
jgi:DnaA family protein